MERFRSKTPVLAVILVLAVTVLSLSNYEAPTFAIPEEANAAAAPAKIALPAKAEVPVKEELKPQGSTSVAKVAGEDSAEYKDGTYYGTGTGFRGAIKVKVVIKDGKIASISVVSSKDDASYFNRAKSLLNKIIFKQSTNVDTVSGATYSSVGLINAVRDALSKAAVSKDAKDANKAKADTEKNSKANKPGKAKPVKPGKAGNFPYPDGTYYGSAEGFASTIMVAVTIKDQSIEDISVISQDEDEEYFEAALAVLKNMVTAQSTDVDTVSGATYSSNGLINATINALKEAKKAADQAKQEAAQSGTKATTDDSEDKTDQTGTSSEDPAKPSDGGSDGEKQPSDSSEGSDPSKGSDGEEPGKTDDGEKDGEEPDAPTEATEPASPYKDGVYEMDAPCYADADEEFDDYTLYLDITLKAGKIVAIDNVEGDGLATNKSYIKRAVNKLVPQIIAQGNADGINAVSGATCTSESILQACRQVFYQAK